MKHKILLLVTFALTIIGSQALALGCPDLSGHYRFNNEPWNGSITVEQSGCQKLTLIQSRGGVITKHQLRIDGRPYVGVEDATRIASLDTPWFQKATWRKDRLVLRQYSGSMRTCSGRYAHNSDRCHLLEYSLIRPSSAQQALWTQEGQWWTDGGSHDFRRYSLERRNGFFMAGN